MDSVTRQLILKLAGYPQVFPPKTEPFTKSNKGLNRDIRKEMHQESQRQSETQMRPPPGNVPMNKAAYELIQKIAVMANKPSSYMTGSEKIKQVSKEKLTPTAKRTPPKTPADVTYPKRDGYSPRSNTSVSNFAKVETLPEKTREWDYQLNKNSSDMRSIIDDIIKGAEQNTFGRPVNIQADTEFTPIDMAKVAGAVVALSEKGYSVKEASEYLGLTEKQIQDIVSTVG